jgi:uncharacterized protein YjbJ (UPF0337 family)
LLQGPEPNRQRKVFHARQRAGTQLQELIVGSTTDKIKGMANEAAGNVKQGVGKIVDNPRLEVEGALQERKGEAQQAVGNAKDAVKKAIDKA